MSGPNEPTGPKKPEKSAILFMQAVRKTSLHKELKELFPKVTPLKKVSSRSKPEIDSNVWRKKSETSRLEQSVRSSLLIMRGMYLQLNALELNEADTTKRQQLLSDIQNIETRLATFKNGIEGVDERVSRKIGDPEVVEDRLADIKDTLEILRALQPPQQEQNIFDTTPDGKVKILSNLLEEAISIGNKNLETLEGKFKKAKL